MLGLIRYVYGDGGDVDGKGGGASGGVGGGTSGGVGGLVVEHVVEWGCWWWRRQGREGVAVLFVVATPGGGVYLPSRHIYGQSVELFLRYGLVGAPNFRFY